MDVFYTDQFALWLPKGHKFPMSKYTLLRQRVQRVQRGVGNGPPVRLRVPHAATDDELTLAHDTGYVTRVQQGELDRQEVRRLGFPWSPQMVERSRRSSGATIGAARAALGQSGESGCGVAVSLAGGTHHAFHDRGEGFCVFNDSVVAARVVQREGAIRRAVVIDCDVHQGNGTAALCAGDPSIFTFSIHGEKNYPYEKETSDLDVALPDGTTDASYLAALEPALERSLDAAGAEIAFYVSGADAWRGDRWGRVALSKAGLRARDRAVFGACRRKGVPVVVTMAGGYAPNVADTVEIHFATVQAAAEHAAGSNDA